jgi:hypothetical protein
MSGPMDCSDRINVMTAERALEPVRLMSEVADLTAVTVRTLCSGRRFDVTVRKVWPGGSDSDAAYTWALTEMEEDGTPLDGGLTADSSASEEPPSADPEDAYWSAADELGSPAS